MDFDRERDRGVVRGRDGGVGSERDRDGDRDEVAGTGTERDRAAETKTESEE